MLQRIESFQFQTTSTRAYAHMRLSRPPLRGNDQRSTYRFDFDFSTNGKTLRRKFSSIVRKPIETSFPVFSLSVTVSRPVERARSKRQRRRDASIRHAATTTVVANAWWKKKKKNGKRRKKGKVGGKKEKKRNPRVHFPRERVVDVIHLRGRRWNSFVANRSVSINFAY